MRLPLLGQMLRAQNGNQYLVKAVFEPDAEGHYSVTLVPRANIADSDSVEFQFTDLEFEGFCMIEGITLS